jgi:2-polyprenyl-3-methyl-5-hydroxy-6-metoxy-1,4-benzoquinol methylase
VSDLRVVDAALDKEGCEACGVVRRRSAGAWAFDSSYTLYDHPPAWPREEARQSAYGGWIAAALDAPPASVLDIGCGNGSLLLALRQRWPGAALSGIDPSSRGVLHAQAAGIHAVSGTTGGLDITADLVVSVNVIEHVPDPVAFLRDAAACAKASGQLVIVCPDGSRPSSELLFADHLWSFAPEQLAALVQQAGMMVVSQSRAPAELGAFQLVRAVVIESTSGTYPQAAAAPALLQAKRDYLRAWSRLDGILLERSQGADRLICFGIGEAAGLLRAYAPATWSRVVECVADDPERGTFGELRVHAWTGAVTDDAILLGVRPGVQPAIARRLEGLASRVVRWDDVVDA